MRRELNIPNIVSDNIYILEKLWINQIEMETDENRPRP